MIIQLDVRFQSSPMVNDWVVAETHANRGRKRAENHVSWVVQRVMPLF